MENIRSDGNNQPIDDLWGMHIRQGARCVVGLT